MDQKNEELTAPPMTDVSEGVLDPPLQQETTTNQECGNMNQSKESKLEDDSDEEAQESETEEESHYGEEETDEEETGSGGGEGEPANELNEGFVGASTSSGSGNNDEALNLVCGSDIRNVGRLGEGAFANTFQGTIMGRNKKLLTIAIKVFNRPIAIEKGCNLQLTNLMGLKHRNVVPIFGVVLDNSNELLNAPTGCPRVLFRFFPQGNLLKYLSNRSNPQDYAMLGKLTLDIIQGCEYLHDRQVIHGNLAARNILIQKSVSEHKTHYNAIVSDYGFAQLAVDTYTPGFSFESSRESDHGQVQCMRIDLIRWMPKELVEQIPNRIKFTKQSDVWSFGVVLWEMWSKGEIPFSYISDREVKKLLVREAKSPLSILRPYNCPDHIVNVMEKIFNVNPMNRPTFQMLNEEFRSFRTHFVNKLKGKDASSKSGTKKKAGDAEKGDVKIRSDPNLTPATVTRGRGGNHWPVQGHARWPNGRQAPRPTFYGPRNPNWRQRQVVPPNGTFGAGNRFHRPQASIPVGPLNSSGLGLAPLPASRQSTSHRPLRFGQIPASSSGDLIAKIQRKEQELLALKSDYQQVSSSRKQDSGVVDIGKRLNRQHIDESNSANQNGARKVGRKVNTQNSD